MWDWLELAERRHADVCGVLFLFRDERIHGSPADAALRRSSVDAGAVCVGIVGML